MFLEEKLTNKLKYGHGFTGKPLCEKVFMTVFEINGQFFFQNDIFKLQADFPKPRIRVIAENGIGSFQTFLIL
jgi:hypothetical protein